MNTNERPLALITGASTGIGYELARQFLIHDYVVLVVAENEEIHSAAERLSDLGGSVAAEQIDLASRQGVEQLNAAVTALGRPLEAAAINAGVGVGGPFLANDLDEEIRLIDLNVVSTVALAKSVATGMVERGRGRILFTSSVIARTPAPFQAVYGASKAFVQSFGQALRNELKDSGVSVTTLLPGPTETEFFERADLMDTKVGAAEKDDPAQVAEQGFKAMIRGEGNVLGGSLKSRGMGLSGALMPDAAGAEYNRRLNEPGSAES
jgi:short-subunit dehydrogenase